MVQARRRVLLSSTAQSWAGGGNRTPALGLTSARQSANGQKNLIAILSGCSASFACCFAVVSVISTTLLGMARSAVLSCLQEPESFVGWTISIPGRSLPDVGSAGPARPAWFEVILGFSVIAGCCSGPLA